MATSSRLDLDYDYPCNEAKPVNKSDVINNQPSTSATHCLNHQSPVSAYYSNRANIIGNNSQTWQHNNGQPSTPCSLETVVPVPNGKLHSGNGVYYDVPKNIPVNPIFATQTATVTTSKFPAQSSALYDKPKLPQKSPAVIKQILASYTSPPPPPITNHPNLMDVTYMNRGTLTKQSTSKPLPPLPGSGNNIYSTPKTIPTLARHVISTTNSNNDDDDEDCDYDYDYVCLESKKKLDDEDENVKKLISKDLQLRYEHLVLNSSGNSSLQTLEKSLQSRSMTNSNRKALFLQSYRNFLSISLKNFESWTKLNLEIIERRPPPSVYINFTKHILLSGQNLILIAKSLNRHFGQMESLNSFADSFYNYLHQIVLKTKKSAGVYPSNKFTKEMADSIRNALQFANNLNIDFNQYMHTL